MRLKSWHTGEVEFFSRTPKFESILGPWSPKCNTFQAYSWYVSNVFIFFDCSMLLYYQSWMFYNHFIVILYHFLVLTYWHSAKCQLLFSACFFTSQEINIKRSPNAMPIYDNFYDDFLVLTYWHSASCQLLFSACFLHRRKSIPNGVQTQRNFLWIFFDQKTSSGPKKHLGVLHPGGLCPPRLPPELPLYSINTPIFQKP